MTTLMTLRDAVAVVSPSLAFFLLLAGCGGPPAEVPHTDAAPRERSGPRSPTGDPSSIVWDYDVATSPALDLAVTARINGPNPGPLRVDDAATKIVENLEVQSGEAWHKASLGDPTWSASCAPRCSIRYVFKLREAAKEAADIDVAILSGGAIFAPPSTWLVRPSDVPNGRYRFRVTMPKAPSTLVFATGVRAAPAPATAGTYEAPASSLEESAFAAFGALRLGHVADPGIERAIAPEITLGDDVIARFLKSEVAAITDYFGHAPDGNAMLFVTPGTSSMTGGKTLGGGGASIVVRLGKGATERDLKEDWVVAHELVHVTFPDLDRRYTWFSEGLATYVEPIARERAGLVTREKVWADMVEGLPQGLPGKDDGGLDGVRDWGRTYWGGALYFFVCDVRIREATKGAKSLQDALRAVVATGANVESMLPIKSILEIGDAATGTTLMRDTYNELGKARGNVDLPALMKRLGVRMDGKTVTFDDAAPLASVRDGILPKK